MRYKLTISYDGTNFHGWQLQKEQRTIQGEIEKALESIFQKRIRITGAGRTDSGVHALGQSAHFDIETNLHCEKIRDALNANITKEIRVQDVAEVSLDFHARFSAKSKVYQYRIGFEYLPTERNYVWFVGWDLNLELVNRASKIITGKHDFTLLAGDLEGRNPKCDIKRIDLTTKTKGIIIEMEGDRFLKQMVRRIVGLIVDVGRGKQPLDKIPRLVNNQEVVNYIVAPAKGLYLIEVIYDR